MLAETNNGVHNTYEIYPELSGGLGGDSLSPLESTWFSTFKCFSKESNLSSLLAFSLS
jgi:hypothetical protein